MALTEDQLVDIRRQIGNDPDDAALNAIYDRTADVDELVLEVLETRLAEMRRNPSSFSVAGKYSESRTAEQLKSLEEQVASLGGDSGTVSVLGISTPDTQAWR